MKKNYTFRTLFFTIISLFASSVSYGQNVSGDYFKSHQTGPWESSSTWEYSHDGSLWVYPATLVPDFLSANVEILAPHTVDINAELFIDQLDIYGTLIVKPGTFFNLLNNASAAVDMYIRSGARFILQSNESNSAVFYKVEGDAVIEQHNNVTVERYIPANRAHRLMTMPLRSGSGSPTSIFSTWQNNGVYQAGKGTLVTANVTPTGINGMDAQTGAPSVQIWNGTGYSPVNDTKNTYLFTTTGSAANKSYFIFVRGDRNTSTLNSTDSNNTTLAATGELQYGGQTFTDGGNTAGRLFLVGNPYASPVDFKNVARTNFYNKFYAWDSRRNDFGGFVLVEGSGNGSYTITPQSGTATTAQDQIIQSTQSVFLQASTNTAATVTFTEASKSNLNKNGMFRPLDNNQRASLRVNLMNFDNNINIKLVDGVLVEYGEGFSNSIDFKEDALKMLNFNENFGIVRNGQDLMVERRSIVSSADTLFFKMTDLLQKSYQLEITPANNDQQLSAFLEDSYLKTSVPVKLDGSVTHYNFTVNTDAASSEEGRFRLIYRQNSVLPLSFLSVNAIQKNKNIQVEWKMASETNIKNYDVERSGNGRSFSVTKKLTSLSTPSIDEVYNWLDEAPLKGDNFYRIKALDLAGEIKYSQIVRLNIENGKSDFMIFPNPVKGNNIFLQFNNKPEGRYTVQLINSQGQVVYSSQVLHAGGSTTQTLNFNKNIIKGVYQLKVNDDVHSFIQKLIIN